jgi:hypothetical protein
VTDSACGLYCAAIRGREAARPDLESGLAAAWTGVEFFPEPQLGVAKVADVSNEEACSIECFPVFAGSGSNRVSR